MQIPAKKERNSNLELYRIIVMFMIIAHHYVVNSGLFEFITQQECSGSTIVMLIFGAWGKTGINCFVMITGYFMCKSKFTWEKLLNLYLQIIFYSVIIYLVFCIIGQECFSTKKFASKFIPIQSITDSFTGCFLLFFMLIPFLNILVNNMNRKQHQRLVLFLFTIYSLLPSIPKFNIHFNYVEWFCVLYILSSYIRFYGLFSRITTKQWGLLSIALILIASASIAGISILSKNTHYPYFFVADSNKIFATLIAISTFMYFKNLNIRYSKFINTVGATTFGVFLIHANSNAMRHWLWIDNVDCIGHFNQSITNTLLYSFTVVLTIFILCSFIDYTRKKLIEPQIYTLSTRIRNIVSKTTA